MVTVMLDPELDTKLYRPVVTVTGYPDPRGSLSDFMVSLDGGTTYLNPNVAPEIFASQPFIVAVIFEITEPVGFLVRTTFEIEVQRKAPDSTDWVTQWTTSDSFDVAIPQGGYLSCITYNFTQGVFDLGLWGFYIKMTGETLGPA